MVEVIDSVVSAYNNVLNAFPDTVQKFITLFLLVFLIALYAIFVWKFYSFIARKNIIGINLNQYNKLQGRGSSMFLAGFFYFVEYIIILPFIIFFWFGAFTLFLLLLNESLSTSEILIVSAVVVAAIRMTAYYNEELSKDLSKMLPLMLLAVSLLDPNFFDFSRIIGHLEQIVVFLQDVAVYLLFIIFLEIILRFFDLIFLWLGIGEVPEVEETEK